MDIIEWIVFLTFFGEVIGRNPFAGCMKQNTYGYGYLEFFDVDILPKDRPDGSEPLDPNAPFYMEFYVRAHHNAHILLAEHSQVEVGLEILLGGGWNTFCQIRQLDLKSRKSLKTKRMANTLSGNEDRGFWIELDSAGNLLVGRKGDDQPFLHYYEKFPFPIRYFSFATWTNTRGVWHFACPKNPPPGEDYEERNITSERLMRNLFIYSNPMNFPERDRNPSQSVQVHLEANSLDLDEKIGKLEISGLACVRWSDLKLRWDPEDYDMIHVIQVTPFMLWTPQIEVLNAATFKRTTFLRQMGSVTINSTGEIVWREPFLSSTYCLTGYHNWPYDSHNCTLIIGFSTNPLKLSIDTMTLTGSVYSNWEIQNPEVNGTVIYINDERNGVQFHLRRRNPSAIIQNFVVPPVLAAATLTLLSFWANPNTFVRLFLCSAGIFVIIVTLIVFSHTLPNVLSTETVGFYHLTVCFYCFPILFFIGLRYLPSNIGLPRCAKNFLKNRTNQILLCFPQLKQVQPGKFLTSEESECSIDAYLLRILYERLIFFIYLVCFLISFITTVIYNEIIL